MFVILLDVGDHYIKHPGACRTPDGGQNHGNYYEPIVNNPSECKYKCDNHIGCVAYESDGGTYCEIHMGTIDHGNGDAGPNGLFNCYIRAGDAYHYLNSRIISFYLWIRNKIIMNYFVMLV